MLPTFFGATFLVFLILSKVPGGPFEKAVMQLKMGMMGGGGESGGGGGGGNRNNDSGQLTPEQLNDLRKQYGLDKPLIIRYLVWLGLWEREVKDKTIAFGEPFRENIKYIAKGTQKYELQRWVKAEKDASGKVLLKHSPIGSDFKFSNDYDELPNADRITQWDLNNTWRLKKQTDTTVTVAQFKRSGILTGDLGKSYTYDRPVSELIAQRLHISTYFGLIGFLLTYIVCIPLGIAKAIRHNSRFDFFSSAAIFVGYAVPGYALGTLLLTLFGGGSFWNVFPLGGFHSENWDTLSFAGKVWDQLHHTFLPVLCYMVGSFATLTILMKNSLMENLNQDYVRTAYSKGLPANKVIYKHALRNSLIPLATGLGHVIGIFLTGSYLIEKVFNIRGIGLLSYEAIVKTDYPVFLGFLVISITISMVGNLLSDILYVLVDPRIKFS